MNGAQWRAEEGGDWDVVLTTAMRNDDAVDRQHAPFDYHSLVVAKRVFDPWCFDTPREEFTAPGQVADGHIGFLVSCIPEGDLDLVLNAPATSERVTLPLTAWTSASADEICRTGA